VIINFYDFLSTVYLLLIIGLSFLGIKLNMLILILYFILGIFFVKKIERLLSIVTLTATIAYFFVGADESIYSLYSIFCIILLLQSFLFLKTKWKPDYKDLVLKCLLIVLSVFSYSKSPFVYTNGLYEFIFIIMFSIIIANFTTIDFSEFIKSLSYLSCVLIVCFFFMLPITGVSIEGRIRISAAVNSNTSGMACAQMGIITFFSYFFHKGKEKKIKLFFFILAGVLVLLSGSRTSLFAMISSIGVVLIIIAHRRGNISKKARKLIMFSMIIGVFLIAILINSGIDLSRYNYVELLKGGGTNRFTIYSAIIPYIIINKYWKYGYGPGHECSRIIVSKLVSRDYAHTHNLFIESFGELGIGGLFLLIFFVIRAFKTSYQRSRISHERYTLLGMLIGLIICGLAESYFCDIYLWILLSLCTNKRERKELLE